MLVKQAIDVSFAQGLDSKTDPKRVQVGKFVQLQNSVFTKAGLLQKRNGFAALPSLPDTTYSYLTTLNENLTAIGPNIAAINASDDSWVSRGSIEPLSLSAMPLLRNNFNQTLGDSAVAPNGLVCTAYIEYNGSTYTNKFVIADSTTGQNITTPTTLTSANTTKNGMRVFVLGDYFIVLYTSVVTGTSYVTYAAIPIAEPSTVTTATMFAYQSAQSATLFDGVVFNNQLYISYCYNNGDILVGALTAELFVVSPPFVHSGAASVLTMCADATTGNIFTVWYDTSASECICLVVDRFLRAQFPFVLMSTFQPVNIGCVATDGFIGVFYEAPNDYASWSSGDVASNYVTSQIFAYPGSPSAQVTVIRSVGLASKPFLIGTTVYFLAAFESTYQPTYFLINGTASTAAAPVIAAKLAYENGGGYLTSGLPGVTVTDNVAQVPYLYKDLITSANKATFVTAPPGNQAGGIYSQTGINLATFTFGTQNLDTAEIGGDLHISGGFLWMYDGFLPVEHNFFLWPDTDAAVTTDVASFTYTPKSPTGTTTLGSTSITLSSATGVVVGMQISDASNPSYILGGTIITGLSGLVATMSTEATHAISGDTLHISGLMASKPDGSTYENAYYYQFTYEWTDNQGNAFRSAPSIPVAVTTANNSDMSGSVTLNIPTLRLTAKTVNPVKICVYRWSVANQEYYQTTSITQPLLNSTTTDMVTFVDINSDATILGNNLIYTTGGVAEDVNAPASDVMTLFDTRLWLVDAEDPNVLWYSKQVIEATPVEMSDLFTLYVPPTTSTQGPTGPILTLAPMDDKLIIGKANSFLYINGTGPDNTGANSQYSPATFITSTVGCANQASIVLMPEGLMFQSDKGIWLLDRGLNTSYIGAPVEDFTTGATVTSAVNVPETNQVRFTLSTGVTLMYDYYYEQWGTFVGPAVNAVSSCIYDGFHTTINALGAAFQEADGTYLDGAVPVLMMFQTGPLNLGTLQGYQRAYFFYILGEYISPHKLVVSLAYDYSKSPSQQTIVSPINYSPPFGAGPSQSPFGQGNPYGGPGSLEDQRVFLERQRCQAFSIQIQEIFDATLGAPAGAGLTISGLNIVLAFKRGFRPQSSATSSG